MLGSLVFVGASRPTGARNVGPLDAAGGTAGAGAGPRGDPVRLLGWPGPVPFGPEGDEGEGDVPAPLLLGAFGGAAQPATRTIDASARRRTAAKGRIGPAI